MIMNGTPRQRLGLPGHLGLLIIATLALPPALAQQPEGNAGDRQPQSGPRGNDKEVLLRGLRHAIELMQEGHVDQAISTLERLHGWIESRDQAEQSRLGGAGTNERQRGDRDDRRPGRQQGEPDEDRRRRQQADRDDRRPGRQQGEPDEDRRRRQQADRDDRRRRRQQGDRDDRRRRRQQADRDDRRRRRDLGDRDRRPDEEADLEALMARIHAAIENAVMAHERVGAAIEAARRRLPPDNERRSDGQSRELRTRQQAAELVQKLDFLRARADRARSAGDEEMARQLHRQVLTLRKEYDALQSRSRAGGGRDDR